MRWLFFFLLLYYLNSFLYANICNYPLDDTYDIDYKCSSRKNLNNTFIKAQKELEKQIADMRKKFAKTGSPNYRSILKQLEKSKLTLENVQKHFMSNMTHSEYEAQINYKKSLWREKNAPLLKDVYGIPIEQGDGSYKHPIQTWSPGY